MQIGSSIKIQNSSNLVSLKPFNKIGDKSTVIFTREYFFTYRYSVNKKIIREV